MPNKTNNNSLLLLGFAALFLILFASYSFGLKPTNDTLEAGKAEIDTLRNGLRILEKKVQEKELAKSTLSDEAIQAALPSGDNLEKLTVDLREIEKASQAKINSVTYNKTAKNDLQILLNSKDTLYPNVHMVETKMEVAGTYVQVSEVIERLQQLPRLTHIDSVDFGTIPINRNSVTPVDNSKEITVNVSFKAYFSAGQPKDAAPAAGTAPEAPPASAAPAAPVVE
ncbi:MULTISPECIES: hypothetical protein [Paenibacillus]|uniref:hypothetical protein n=1 Tax=Paenibacillus TaxID=44249 RepID=UPI0022B93AA8|nr:hypothetical protein [Paenibacillus caseinilyticus]MCZ8519778.1 hypothetical protein [Paenibacillus caseinilyticus]